MIKQLKNNIDFHQSSWNRLRQIDPKQAAFHQGAVMAFAKCVTLFERQITEQADSADSENQCGFVIPAVRKNCNDYRNGECITRCR